MLGRRKKRDNFSQGTESNGRIKKVSLKVDAPPQVDVQEKKIYIYGYRYYHESDVSNVRNELIFNLWNEIRAESGRNICIFWTVYGSDVSGMFYFMAYDFEKV